jgi:hypothetical protein
MGARRSVDEEALMQAYAEGDADAFQQLFDSLSPALQAFFRRSVGAILGITEGAAKLRAFRACALGRE